MKHKESDLQIRCVTWFRYKYPQFARLLEHPKNEGNGDRRQGAIAKAEGVQAGVADLILHVPSMSGECSSNSLFTEAGYFFSSLAIEMKKADGRQSPEQKQWQRLFEAAGGKYVIVRSYDDFVSELTHWMLNVPMIVRKAVKAAYADIQREADDEARAQLRKIINS